MSWVGSRAHVECVRQDIVVDPDIASLPIAEFVEYYEDASETLRIDDVLAPNFGVNFIPHDRDILHFGITSSAYWIRFNLDWSGSDGQSQVLEFGPPKLVAGILRGGIELFVVDDVGNLVLQYTMGTQTSEREIKTLNRGFALLIDPSFGSHFLLRITSARPLRLPITLWKVEDFRQAAQNADNLLGMQYGILLAMVFFNLFLFFSIKDPSYLFYVVAIATQTLFIFLDSKHLRFIFDELYRGSYWIDMSERLIYPATIITALMFQRSLLKIWEYNIKLDNLLKVLLGGLVLVIVLTFVPDEKVFQYPLILLIVVSIPLAFYNNLDAIRRGNVTAVIHMSAMAVFLIGATILLLRELWPSFPNNAFTGSAYKIGLIGQALLMSLSLSHRYNQIKRGWYQWIDATLYLMY